MTLRTQVAIIGAGPAGLMLSHLLHRAGVASIVLEARERDYVENRVRAGVLEFETRALLERTGVGERLRREGLVHHGIEFRFAGRSERVDFHALTGKSVTVYGQQEVVKDLISARLADRGDLRFGTDVVEIDPTETATSVTARTRDGERLHIDADFIAGCDGFHGPSRAAIPQGAIASYDYVFPFSWLGILAESPPVAEELIYANHERGFALVSMRSRTVSRLYLQCRNDEVLEAWPDRRIWEELRVRLDSDRGGPAVIAGTVLQKGITPMRSFVCAPMRYRNLFLAGDAAHIVPPTGAKGMNLAIADVAVLARAFAEYYTRGERAGLESYSDTVLRRVWKTQRFSTSMTNMLHRFDDHGSFERQVQLAELDYVTSSQAAATSIAESYVGLPFEHARPVVTDDGKIHA